MLSFKQIEHEKIQDSRFIDQFSINQNVLLISNETIFKNLLGNVKIKKKDKFSDHA